MKLAVYPGSFDPLTNGHVDIIERGHAPVRQDHRRHAGQRGQGAALHTQERVEIVRDVFKGRPNVEVDTFDGLLVDYVAEAQAPT